MRILHTSDWHLGGYLHEQSRIPEQAAFLDWLKKLMADEKPDALIVAGDIFDSCAPSNIAQNLYYDFLSATFKSELCRAVVVIGGNHDSPSLLDAPGNALAHLKTRVIGAVEYFNGAAGKYAPIFEKEVVIVPDDKGNPGLVIGAVPYLRDADLRTLEAMETPADRSEKIMRGFQSHYKVVAELARQKATNKDGSSLPLVLTGHLFLSGAKTADEKSERALQIGNLNALEMGLLPPADYYALGHLHCPQNIGGNDACRYSGAPIPMSFGEANQEKSVVIVDFMPNQKAVVRTVPIPQTQKLAQLKGDPEEIAVKLKEFVGTLESIWVDIQITKGEGDLGPWWNQFTTMIEGSATRLLRWQNARPRKEGFTLAAAVLDDAKLEDISPEKLFAMRLDDENLTDVEKADYSAMFAEICKQSAEADNNKD